MIKNEIKDQVEEWKNDSYNYAEQICLLFNSFFSNKLNGYIVSSFNLDIDEGNEIVLLLQIDVSGKDYDYNYKKCIKDIQRAIKYNQHFFNEIFGSMGDHSETLEQPFILNTSVVFPITALK